MFCRSIIFYHLRRSLWSSSVLANRYFSCFWPFKLYEIEERVVFHSRNHWCSFPEKVCLMLFVTDFFYIWSICVYDKWKLKWFLYVRLTWSILLLNLMLLMQIDLNWRTLFSKFLELTFGSCICKFISFSSYLQDALRTFLLRKLDNLEKDDKCQITMISTWATELYLDKILLWAWHLIGKLFTTFIHLSFILWIIAWII